MEEQIDSILFLLPEDERNTIKSFLLMQHERIERLESLYVSLRDDLWSKEWEIKNITESELIKVNEMLHQQNYRNVYQNAHYNIFSKNLFIQFKTIRCQACLIEMFNNIDIDIKNNIMTSKPIVYYSNGWKPLWVWVRDNGI